MERLYLTGIPELDWNSLLRMDYQTLLTACQVNSQVRAICQEENFWRGKVNRDFKVSRHKLPNETYQQQYDFLYRLPQTPVIDRGSPYINRLDAVTLLLQRGASISRHVLSLYLREDRVPFLQELYRQGYQFGVDHANAAVNGSFNTLRWLASIGFYPDQEGVNEATAEDNIELLEWLSSQGLTPDEEGANISAASCALDALDWIEEKQGIFPDVSGANSAAENGCLNVLDWLEERDIYPDAVGIEAGYDDPDVALWLQDRGMFPEEEF